MKKTMVVLVVAALLMGAVGVKAAKAEDRAISSQNLIAAITAMNNSRLVEPSDADDSRERDNIDVIRRGDDREETPMIFDPVLLSPDIRPNFSCQDGRASLEDITIIMNLRYNNRRFHITNVVVIGDNLYFSADERTSRISKCAVRGGGEPSAVICKLEREDFGDGLFQFNVLFAPYSENSAARLEAERRIFETVDLNRFFRTYLSNIDRITDRVCGSERPPVAEDNTGDGAEELVVQEDTLTDEALVANEIVVVEEPMIEKVAKEDVAPLPDATAEASGEDDGGCSLVTTATATSALPLLLSMLPVAIVALRRKF